MTDMRPKSLVFACLIVLLTASWLRPAGAQEASLSTVPELTVQALQHRIERVRADTELTEETRQTLADLYAQAGGRLEAAQEWKRKAQEYEEARRAAPEVLESIRRELEREPAEVQIEAPEAPVAELQSRLANAEAELTAARQQVSELEAEQKYRAERRVEVPKLEGEARQKLQEVNQKLAAELPQDAGPEQVARRTLSLAQKEALEAELEAYEQELRSYEARGELLAARRARASRALTQAQERVDRWQEVVRAKRREEAAEAARQATQEVAEAHPALREIAETNRELAVERAEALTPKLEHSATQLKDVQQELTRLRDDLQRTREKVQRAGLTKALGLLLRKKQAELPNVRRYQRQIQERQPEIADVQLRLFELDEQRTALADTEGRIEEIVRELDGSLSEQERESIAGAAGDLMRTRRDLVGALYRDYDSYFDRLVDLDTRARELTELVREYRAFIEEHILWFRSSASLEPADAGRAVAAVQRLLDPDSWWGLLRSVLRDARRRPLGYGVVALVFLALMVFRSRLNAALARSGELAANIRTDRIVHTFGALGATVLLSVTWPWLMLGAGWLLRTAYQAADFTKGVGAGLQGAGLALLTVAFLRIACREDGLADVHFRFRARPLKMLRRNLWWLVCFIAPVAFVVIFFEWMGDETQRDSLARMAFIVGQLAGAVFLWRILRRRGGVFQELLDRREGGWLDRLRYAWYALAMAVPLGLAAAAATGYYYTALVLTTRLCITFWLFMGLVLLYELMQRWLFVARRKLALEQARKRREETEAAETPEGEKLEVEPEVNIQAVSAQSRQLLRTALWFAFALVLWFVWNDVVPALGILGDITLEQDVPITLADVGMSLLLVVITILAAKNIPGLLEIAALQYLPLEPAVRFAISRVCRYAITVVGIILAFNAIGIGWDKVQWLAAAVTVGLGFGLQEIFANFVSGLIILFERPMRVGDTVTVGDVTGTVSKIRIRATTILDWDRKELVVPNREFITGRLVNWSLSDNIVRAIIPVGIAYGSDTEKAERILLRVARENSMVLDEPEPKALFLGFGDSSLNFELRVYVPGIESFITVRHALHMAIDKAFRQEGIEISFPQQDVHIRSIRATLPIEDRGEKD
ncbi:MAG: mechanosensitive ion channel [Candidatus Brocadiia bacterium]